MNRKKYIALTLMLSLLGINNVYAACSNQGLEEFSKIADKYKITTTFNEKNKTYTMRIEEGEPKKYSYVFTIDYQYDCKEISKTVTECTGLKNGSSFYATIMGNTKECSGFIKEEQIKLTRYNEFYGDPLCSGIEEFVLCQKFYDREIDRETFEKRIALYKKNKQKEETKEQEKTENNLSNKIKNYLKDNLIEVIIVMVFIILVIISSIVGYKFIRKSRRLE